MAVGSTMATTLRAVVHPLTGGSDDYDPLLQLIGDARVVLLGRRVTELTNFIVSAPVSPGA